jgi:hypothetical protein
VVGHWDIAHASHLDGDPIRRPGRSGHFADLAFGAEGDLKGRLLAAGQVEHQARLLRGRR